jgi:hypothetical protein
MLNSLNNLALTIYQAEKHLNLIIEAGLLSEYYKMADRATKTPTLFYNETE